MRIPSPIIQTWKGCDMCISLPPDGSAWLQLADARDMCCQACRLLRLMFKLRAAHLQLRVSSVSTPSRSQVRAGCWLLWRVQTSPQELQGLMQASAHQFRL